MPNPWAVQLAKLGNVGNSVEPADVDSVVYLWPENVLAWRHWLALRNQWMVGLGGPYAINLGAVSTHLTECGLQGEERRDVYDGVLACAEVVLELMAQQKQQKQSIAKTR